MPITNLISLLCLCLCLSLCVSVSLSFFSCHHRLVSHSLYHTIYLRLFCLSIFLLFDISPLNLLSPFFYFSPAFDCTHTHSMRYYLSPFAYRSPPLLISLRSIFFVVLLRIRTPLDFVLASRTFRLSICLPNWPLT